MANLEVTDEVSSFKDLEAGSDTGTSQAGWPPTAFDFDFTKGDRIEDAASEFPKKQLAHELNGLSYHRTLEEFGRKLQEAAEATITTRRKSNYNKVTVLLMYWENEDNRLLFKIGQLACAFERYNFTVQRWAIPINNKSHQEVYRKADKLIEDDDKLQLRIVYYAGRAHLSDRGVVWTAQMEDHSPHRRSPRVSWTAIQTLLEESSVDILILLDCALKRIPSSEGGNGVTSLITAGAFSTVERYGDRYAFIDVLTRQLDELRKVHSFSTSFLFSRIYLDIQNRPKQLDNSHKALPVHLILSQDHGYPRDILLSVGWEVDRFKKQSDKSATKKCLSRAGTPTRWGPWDLEADLNATPDRSSPTASLTEVSNQPRLLLSFRLLEDMDPDALKVDMFAQWLGSLPIPVDAVKVEAGFASDSTILLVSVPMCFLTFLPLDPSANLIGTIQSSNLLYTRSTSRTASDEVITSTPAVVESEAGAIRTIRPTVTECLICEPICHGLLDQTELLRGCEISPDGTMFACWGVNNLILIAWDPEIGRPAHVVIEQLSAPVEDETGLAQNFYAALFPQGDRGSWQAVAFTRRHLIAATDHTRFTVREPPRFFMSTPRHVPLLTLPYSAMCLISATEYRENLT